MDRYLVKVSKCYYLILKFLDRNSFLNVFFNAFGFWQVLVEITKIPLNFFLCGSFWFVTSALLSKFPSVSFLGGREGCTRHMVHVLQWSGFKNVKDVSQNNSLFMLLQKVSDVSKLVLMYCLIILWFFLMVISYFQTTNLMLVSTEARKVLGGIGVWKTF